MIGSLHFEEESRLVPDIRAFIDPSAAVGTGAACAADGGRILVAHSGEKGSGALAACFAAGAASRGADCISAGIMTASGAAYAAKALGCRLSCFIHTELSASFILTGEDGLPLFPDEEENIEGQLSALFEPLPYSHYGTVTSFGGAGELYAAAVGRLLPRELGVFADIHSPSEAIISLWDGLLNGRNDRSGERIAFHFSSDGRQVSAYSESTGYIFSDKLRLICMRELFERGEDAAVCGNVKKAEQRLAEDMGRKVISCGHRVCTDSCRRSEKCIRARKLASEQLFTHDGTAMAAMVLKIISEKKISPARLTEGLPSFTEISRYIPADKPSELLRRLCATVPDGERGVILDEPSKRVTVRPVRTGRGLMLCVECSEAEIASELCDLYGKRLAAKV